MTTFMRHYPGLWTVVEEYRRSDWSNECNIITYQGDNLTLKKVVVALNQMKNKKAKVE